MSARVCVGILACLVASSASAQPHDHVRGRRYQSFLDRHEARIASTRFGGGLSIGLSSVSAVFRVRALDWPLVEHVDVRLTGTLGGALNEPHGWVAAMQVLTLATAEVALLADTRVHPVVGASWGMSVFGLRYDGVAPAGLGHVGVLLDPKGPFELRAAVYGGLVGHARDLATGDPMPGFGLAFDLAFGAVW